MHDVASNVCFYRLAEKVNGYHELYSIYRFHVYSSIFLSRGESASRAQTLSQA